MLIVISPAKRMETSERNVQTLTQPNFQNEANNLVHQLKELQQIDLKTLMNISDDLAKLNHERYLNWQVTPHKNNLKQALLYFKGMVFIGIDAESLSDKNLEEAQKRLRILSGLYGVLRPLDGIQAYRLEMGTPWAATGFKNLYEYWGEKITENLQKELEVGKHKALINLASQEYFKSINPKKLNVPIITPSFKDDRGKGYKTMAVYAKKARGLMTRFIIENKINRTEDLQAFDCEGYHYNAELSRKNKPVFTRSH